MSQATDSSQSPSIHQPPLARDGSEHMLSGDCRPVYQHTFARPISCNGIGIHGGQRVTVTFRPAPIHTGIVFVRTDLSADTPLSTGQGAKSPNGHSANRTISAGVPIAALYTNRARTHNFTQIALPVANPHHGDGQNGGQVGVATIEHIMAALAAFDIDNAVIEIDGPEAPIMDGSSSPFVTLFQRAGKTVQKAPRQYLQILKSVVVTQETPKGTKTCRFDPAPTPSTAHHLTLTYRALDANADPLLDAQSFTYTHSWAAFRQHIASARTVGFYDDIQRLQSMGLGLGGSLDNTVVLRGGCVLNPEGLRFADEFARHKVLDALGDLLLAGHPLMGRFTSVGGGHALNAQALDTLMSQPDAYRLITLSDALVADKTDAHEQTDNSVAPDHPPEQVGDPVAMPFVFYAKRGYKTGYKAGYKNSYKEDPRGVGIQAQQV